MATVIREELRTSFPPLGFGITAGAPMYAIGFDMDIESLRTHYGDPYNNAYVEIRKVLLPCLQLTPKFFDGLSFGLRYCFFRLL